MTTIRSSVIRRIGASACATALVMTGLMSASASAAGGTVNISSSAACTDSNNNPKPAQQFWVGGSGFPTDQTVNLTIVNGTNANDTIVVPTTSSFTPAAPDGTFCLGPFTLPAGRYKAFVGPNSPKNSDKSKVFTVLAAVYPPAGPTVEFSSAAPVPGATVNLVAAGFCPNTEVTFTIDGVVVDTVTADNDGVASATVQAPSKPGKNTVVATSNAGGACSLSQSSSLAVLGQLPATGSDSRTPLQAGGLAVLAGACLIIVAMIRRRHPSTAAA
jgi:LPXTG-motif cell wall-anchored protein